MKQAVVQWLNQHDQADFHQGVILLMKLNEKIHGLNQRTSETFKMVRQRLQKRLIDNTLEGEVVKEAITLPQVEETEETPMVEMSEQAKLNIDKRNLYNLRRKLSNSLHDCSSDKERASTYAKIMAIEDEYRATDYKIKYLDKTGQLPPEPKQESPKIPNDPAEAYRKLTNARANRSKKLKRMEQFPKGHPNHIKAHQQYMAIERQIKELQKIVNAH